ncbi:MAG: sulfur carrier protein ThiS [Bacillota bacterium]|nr:sulfur carrier protein ThiS [Bacillota bacterium]
MIEVNGRKMDWRDNLTVEKLLSEMNYTYPMILVKVNGQPVKAEEWSEFIIPDNAVVQAHHLIAGG